MKIQKIHNSRLFLDLNFNKDSHNAWLWLLTIETLIKPRPLTMAYQAKIL
jgi:hypothetical protein